MNFILAAVFYLNAQHVSLPALRFENEALCREYGARLEQEANQSAVRVRWVCSRAWGGLK